jgi:S1-C subfamily serine protease
MPFPRLPVGVVYGAVVVALIFAALGRRENADSPEAPPPPSAEEGALLAPASAFDPAIVVKTPAGPAGPSSGTAFSVADHGVWLTARHVVAGCRKIALMESPGRAAEADIAPGGLAPDNERPSDLAVLVTRGGAPALPLAPAALRLGERSFHPGYPQGKAGEATSRLIGRQTLVLRGRTVPGRLAASRAEQVLAWAEAGRTDGLKGDLSGLSGAPVLDARGQVVAVTLAEAPRRGRIYTTPPEAIRAALARAHIALPTGPPTDPVTVENYGRVADALRRDLRVTQVVCLDR